MTDPQQHEATSRVAALEQKVERIQRQLRRITALLGSSSHDGSQPDHGDTSEDDEKEKPGQWVWLDPPATDADPRVFIAEFVDFYNRVYVGLDNTRAVPIPPCWQRHPGLAAEIATVAYTWRAANLGEQASAAAAQQWHHHYRVGFAERMRREWTHPDCHDGAHHPTAAGELTDRFTRAAGEPDSASTDTSHDHEQGR